MTTRYTPRESFWRGHWEAIDGSAQPTLNEDAAAYQRGAEHGARALAEAMRCKTYRERWAWIRRYASLVPTDDGDDSAYLAAQDARDAARRETNL